MQAQFDAEQEQLKAISYLSAEEQAKYAERQSISFMCAPKPPDFGAILQACPEAGAVGIGT